jgi:hypothetical protein
MGELRITISENEEKVEQTQKAQLDLKSKISKYKNEKLDRDGLSQDANIEVLLESIEVKDLKMITKMDKVEIQLKLGSFNQKYQALSQIEERLLFNQTVTL